MVAAMIAFYHCRQTGEGQHVDVSICESLLMFSGNAAPFWYMLHENLKRHGDYREGTAGKALTRLLWPCKDGYVSFVVMGTPSGVRSNRKLMELMDDEGLAELKKNGQIVFRYVDNPNGAVDDIAGIVNKKRNVLGMMPHPERCSESELTSSDGRAVWASIVGWLKDNGKK